VVGVPTAVRAELLHLKTVRVVAPVLLGDVVAVLALLASQRDLRPDIGGSHDGVPFYYTERDWTIKVTGPEATERRPKAADHAPPLSSGDRT
jgi:hypothetical protein